MIKVVKTSSKGIKEFSEKEWPFANFENYGIKEPWRTSKYVFKATEDGKIVGIITAKFTEGVFYIEDLLVAHNKKRVGVGRLLINKAEELAKKHNAHKIHLVTEGWASEKFYRKLGYMEEALLKKHYVGLDFTIFSKYL